MLLQECLIFANFVVTSWEIRAYRQTSRGQGPNVDFVDLCHDSG